jgi:flagellar hook protein FlgE
MSLFGAMNSGVSGLASQSSAMAAISDNITNVNTVGYKGTKVDFQTLVTRQASNSLYSPGGVQSRPRNGIDVQGLLQTSSSATDLAISGDGFFLVNEAPQPGASDQYLFSRAGSFYTDNLGYLKNTGGYYLQAWPTDRQGNIILPSGNTGLTNQNIISGQFLETVNLNRVGGTADETTNISIGANLPANDSVGASHDIDVQFFDTLGNTNAVAFRFNKTATNQWDLAVEPPKDTGAVTLYDGGNPANVYKSVGQLEFATLPMDGDTIELAIPPGSAAPTIYEFDDPAGATPGVAAGNVAVTIVGGDLAQTVANLIAAIGTNASFGSSASGMNTVALKADSTSTILLAGGTNAGGADFAIDASGCSATRQSLLQSPSFTISKQGAPTPPAVTLAPAIAFNADGLPKAFGVGKMAVDGFVSGAASMDGTSASQITLDFGSLGEADGITQLSAEFTPNFIEQDGARFGVFSGVTISSDGLVSALFDNGERRPIYRVPLVTFVNPDGLEAQTGNVWNTTEASGNPTLRVADSGPAGQVVQSSLEASTVDIGEEFTDMIVVQRAYSAATRIISTADEMLEELVRIKR